MHPNTAPRRRSTSRVALALVLCTVLGVGLGACQSMSRDHSIGGAWRIDQAEREPILDRSQARIDFGPAGQMSGHTSCNTMRASYTLEGTKLKLGPVITTRMSCPRLQLEQEDRILTALEAAVDARVRPDDGLLELRDAEGRGVLRGTRFGPDGH